MTYPKHHCIQDVSWSSDIILICVSEEFVSLWSSHLNWNSLTSTTAPILTSCLNMNPSQTQPQCVLSLVNELSFQHKGQLSVLPSTHAHTHTLSKVIVWSVSASKRAQHTWTKDLSGLVKAASRHVVQSSGLTRSIRVRGRYFPRPSVTVFRRRDWQDWHEGSWFWWRKLIRGLKMQWGKEKSPPDKAVVYFQMGKCCEWRLHSA